MGFKKALGILSKAKQGSLFAKPVKPVSTNYVEGNHHPDVLGHTRSGKAVRVAGVMRPTGRRLADHAHQFIGQYKGWSHQDHADAATIHDNQSRHAYRTHDKQYDDHGGTLWPQTFREEARRDALLNSAAHHDAMERVHHTLSLRGCNKENLLNRLLVAKDLETAQTHYGLGAHQQEAHE